MDSFIIYTYLLTCTCIGFHPGRVEPVSYRTSNMLLIEEGSQVLPGKTPCLPQIFHGRIDRATRGRRLPEQTPPRGRIIGFILFPRVLVLYEKQLVWSTITITPHALPLYIYIYIYIYNGNESDSKVKIEKTK